MKNARGMLIILIATATVLTGCWNVTGRPLDLNPSQLLTHALDAHHRGDDRAFRTLLGRLLREAPKSEEAVLARTLLITLAPTKDNLMPGVDSVGAPDSSPGEDP